MLLQKLFDPIVTFLAEEHGRSSPGKSADRSQWHHPLPIKEVNQAKGNHRRLANHSRTCLTTARRVPDDCLTTAWWLPYDCLTISWRLPDDCLTTACLMPDECLTNAWRPPNECLTNACRMLDECQTNAWQMPDKCLTTAWRLLDDCQILKCIKYCKKPALSHND